MGPCASYVTVENDEIRLFQSETAGDTALLEFSGGPKSCRLAVAQAQRIESLANSLCAAGFLVDFDLRRALVFGTPLAEAQVEGIRRLQEIFPKDWSVAHYLSHVAGAWAEWTIQWAGNVLGFREYLESRPRPVQVAPPDSDIPIVVTESEEREQSPRDLLAEVHERFPDRIQWPDQPDTNPVGIWRSLERTSAGRHRQVKTFQDRQHVRFPASLESFIEVCGYPNIQANQFGDSVTPINLSDFPRYHLKKRSPSFLDLDDLVRYAGDESAKGFYLPDGIVYICLCDRPTEEREFLWLYFGERDDTIRLAPLARRFSNLLFLTLYGITDALFQPEIAATTADRLVEDAAREQERRDVYVRLLDSVTGAARDTESLGLKLAWALDRDQPWLELGTQRLKERVERLRERLLG